MKQNKYPFAEIKSENNLFSIENFNHYAEDAKGDNPYNTTFYIRVISGEFRGYAFCEYDIKEFGKFIDGMEELYQFKRREVELKDIGYGNKVTFTADRAGHIEISGEIFGEERLNSLTFAFTTDQTVLPSFIKTVREYVG